MITDLLRALEKDATIQQHLAVFKTHGVFTFHDIKILKELVLILQPFQEALTKGKKILKESALLFLPIFTCGTL